MIYFDNAASAPLCEEAKAALIRETEAFANPSSLHRLGYEAELRLKEARAAVARSLGAQPEEIFFTSGGTEADNWAILAAARKMKKAGNHILTTDSEHPAVAEPLKKLEEEGFAVTRLSTRGGALDPAEAAAAVSEKTVLVACMHTNNETGARYDLAAVIRLAKAKNPRCLAFSDGVQGYLKSDFVPAALGLDLMSVSAHKIGGPKGVGALWIRRGVSLPPLILGGGQERNLRSGTENLPGIVAFGAAAAARSASLKEDLARMGAVRETVLAGLSGVAGIRFNLPRDPSCHVLSLQVDGWRSEALLHALSEKDVFVSSGSACSSHKGRGPVLTNFGLTKDEADRTLRLSFAPGNTAAEAEAFCRAVKELVRP
ncbi:MAG: cysteine desulfurase [Clostridia bacterium]|nr:cysteine desulfurase [Clostridia bacterium]